MTAGSGRDAWTGRAMGTSLLTTGPTQRIASLTCSRWGKSRRGHRSITSASDRLVSILTTSKPSLLKIMRERAVGTESIKPTASEAMSLRLQTHTSATAIGVVEHAERSTYGRNTIPRTRERNPVVFLSSIGRFTASKAIRSSATINSFSFGVTGTLSATAKRAGVKAHLHTPAEIAKKCLPLRRIAVAMSAAKEQKTEPPSFVLWRKRLSLCLTPS
jgi:hypothetical protein